MSASVYRSEAGRDAITAWCHAAIDGWTTPHETRVLRTRLGNTSVVVAGGGRDAPVVVLPGTNFSAAAMLPFATYLTRHRHGQVLLVDLPGQPGLSDEHRAPNPPAYGEWLDEVLGQLDPTPPPIVLGHSLGAAVALHATPRPATPLVLVAPAGFVGAALSLPLLKTTMAWLLRPSDVSADALATFMSSPFHDPPAATVTWLRLVGRHCRATKAPPPLDGPHLARWRGHDIRLLLGADDPFFKPDKVLAAVRRVGLEPSVSVSVVDGAGHLLPEERPQAIVDALRR